MSVRGQCDVSMCGQRRVNMCIVIRQFADTEMRSD